MKRNSKIVTGAALLTALAALSSGCTRLAPAVYGPPPTFRETSTVTPVPAVIPDSITEESVEYSPPPDFRNSTETYTAEPEDPQ